MSIENLLDKTLLSIEGMKKGSDKVIFVTSDGKKFRMFHAQECCESVDLDDVVGEPEDLLNSPITLAEEVTSKENPKWTSQHDFTWTFYKLGTVKGVVTLRWYGESNGYYSESVDFEEG